MIKIGLVGHGKWGKNHARILKNSECDFVGIADLSETIAEISHLYNTRWFKDYRELLPFVDAVLIVTPTNTHHQIAKTFLKNNKHTFVEKPLTLSEKESKELINIAEKNNLILSAGYLFRFNKAIHALQDLLPSVGRIHYVTARYIGSGKPPRTDSGAIMNLAVHLVDILEMLFGKEYSIRKNCSNIISQKYEDSAILELRYKNFFCIVEVSCVHPEKKRDIWIVGEHKSVYVDLFEENITEFRQELPQKPRGESALIASNKNFKSGELLEKELLHFLSLVEKTKNGVLIHKKENRGIPNISMETKLLNLRSDNGNI